MDKLWDKLERLGIRPERLQLEWISAAEGQKWANTMKDLEKMRDQVTQEEIEYTMKVLKEDREKAEARKKKKAEMKESVKEIPINVIA